MPRYDVPEMQDGHLPPEGEATIPELRQAVGIRHVDNRARTRSERRLTTLTARELRAIELTAAGATYAQVATILDLTPTNARLLVERALARRALEISAREMPAAKALQLERLETLLRRWFPLAVGNPRDGTPPSERGAMVTLSIMDRMNRITGVEAPLRVEQEITVDSVSHDDLVARQERILAGLAEVRERHQAIEGSFEERT